MTIQFNISLRLSQHNFETFKIVAKFYYSVKINPRRELYLVCRRVNSGMGPGGEDKGLLNESNKKKIKLTKYVAQLQIIRFLLNRLD